MKVRVQFTSMNVPQNALIDRYLFQKVDFVSEVYRSFLDSNDDVLFLVWNPNISQFMTVGASRTYLDLNIPIANRIYKVARDVLLEE